MKKTTRTKLKLDKQTIAALTKDELRDANGAQMSIGTWACTWWGCTITLSQCG